MASPTKAARMGQEFIDAPPDQYPFYCRVLRPNFKVEFVAVSVDAVMARLRESDLSLMVTTASQILIEKRKNA